MSIWHEDCDHHDDDDDESDDDNDGDDDDHEDDLGEDWALYNLSKITLKMPGGI